MKRVTILLTALFFASLISLPPNVSAADSPLAQVHATINDVLAILQTNAADKPALISQAIQPRFDFEKMAQLVLHRYWEKQNESDRREFMHLFAKLLEKTYISKICLYSAPKVFYVRERQRGDKAEVDTRIEVAGNTNIMVSYRLHIDKNEWKIYDVNVEGVSLVRNYRTQLASVLQHNDFQALLDMIKKKVS